MCFHHLPQDKLAAVYAELGDASLKPVPYRVLIEHPLIQDLVVACKTFKALVSPQPALHCTRHCVRHCHLSFSPSFSISLFTQPPHPGPCRGLQNLQGTGQSPACLALHQTLSPPLPFVFLSFFLHLSLYTTPSSRTSSWPPKPSRHWSVPSLPCTAPDTESATAICLSLLLSPSLSLHNPLIQDLVSSWPWSAKPSRHWSVPSLPCTAPDTESATAICLSLLLSLSLSLHNPLIQDLVSSWPWSAKPARYWSVPSLPCAAPASQLDTSCPSHKAFLLLVCGWTIGLFLRVYQLLLFLSPLAFLSLSLSLSLCLSLTNPSLLFICIQKMELFLSLTVKNTCLSPHLS